jgi:hypothetical protein
VAEEPREEREPTGGVRSVGRRVLGVAMLVVLLVASAIGLDRIGVAAPGATAAAGTGPSGIWLCPHGGGQGWSGWVVVANPGPAAVTVRATTLGDGRSPVVATFEVGPGAIAYREVPATSPEASTAVEFFGGWVAAAATLQSIGDPAGLATERCVGSHRTWFLPDGSTGPDRSSTVVVMNPFDADAAVDATFRTEQRELTPEALTPLVVPAHASVAVSVGDFVLLGPDEHSVSVTLGTRLGRVAAGEVGVSPGGIRGEAGSPAAMGRWTFAAGGVDSWSIPIENPLDDPVDVSLQVEGTDGAQAVPDLQGARLESGEVRTLDVTGLGNVAAIVQAEPGGAVAAMARLTEEDDTATVGGAARGYRAWMVLPGVPPAGGPAFVVLENPTLDDAEVALSLLGVDGPVAGQGLADVEVPASRTVVVKLPESTKDNPVAALVRASRGVVVAASTSYPAEGTGYAVTLGVPLP